MPDDLMRKVSYLGVASIFISIIGALALRQIATANTSGWTTSTITIFEVILPVVGVVTFILVFVPKIRARTGEIE